MGERIALPWDRGARRAATSGVVASCRQVLGRPGWQWSARVSGPVRRCGWADTEEAGREAADLALLDDGWVLR